MAGLLYNVSNTNNYLRTGQYYWTFSPYVFNSSYAKIWVVISSGDLSASSEVTNTLALRPVINILSQDLVTGDGSLTNPFKIK